MRHTLTLLFVLTVPLVSAAAERPNIVIILADDMGYGDVQALNPQSKIPTPNIDSIAAGGMTFRDGHSPSGVCTPTRYGLITGRYCWRSRLKKGVLGGYSEPLIEKTRPTIATMLRGAGYHTGAVGKWHLGMAMPKKNANADTKTWSGDPGIDFAGVITDSPVHHGFDSYFGVSASLDMAPFVYVRNDRFTMLPTIRQKAVKFPHFVRKGPRAKDFVIDEVLDRLTNEATKFVADAAKGDRPFFLYMPLTAPHKPTQPSKQFKGKSGLGEYGDFVMQVDWTVGEVLKSLNTAGVADNTLLLFTSDNGSYMHRYDDDRKDHVKNGSIQGYQATHHRANGPFRGTKADIYEAGHHVPLLARWPGKIVKKSRCETTVCLTDFFATCADVAGAKIEKGAAEDSYSLLKMMHGTSTERGAPVIHHSAGGMFAIRKGKWKMIAGNGSGGRAKPRGKRFGKPYQLFDMTADIGERTDLAKKHPELITSLSAELEKIGRGDLAR